ncbi:MAG: AzlC family ABC transporter permease [Xenococcaceae cyanobacterium MO_188.B29]|nr:AzlC family ABC transporter permease [Xenococcaceae cyanobacterium MO_188.B29]
MSYSQVKNNSPLNEFIAGAKGIVPLIIGAIPFGIIFGTLAQSSGLSFGGAMAMSAFVFAGSAQFIALGLLAVGTALPVIILTTFVVNLRHLLYSLSLVPHVQNLSPVWKLILGFWLTDEAFAVAINRYNQSDRSRYKHWYYFGAAVFMYVNWQICTFIGLTLGHLIPDAASWGLDFAMLVTFIGMVIPYLKNKPMIITVVISGITALLTRNLPHQSGLIVAATAGIIAGMIVEKKTSSE